MTSRGENVLATQTVFEVVDTFPVLISPDETLKTFFVAFFPFSGITRPFSNQQEMSWLLVIQHLMTPLPNSACL